MVFSESHCVALNKLTCLRANGGAGKGWFVSLVWYTSWRCISVEVQMLVFTRNQLLAARDLPSVLINRPFLLSWRLQSSPW